MNGIQKIFYKLSGAKALSNLPAVINRSLNSDPRFIGLNNGVTIYPYSNDQTYIEKGYNKNAWVYAIVSKLAKKFGQIPFYHYRIKTTERKTWAEYTLLSKTEGFSQKLMIELRKMRTKSVDQVVVDSPLSKLLAKPNRNQSGAQFREQLYGYKLLTGEGNTFLSRLEPNDKPRELFIIPKDNLALVKGNDPWDISEYVLILGAERFVQSKDNIIMWISSGYTFDPYTLQHLRGQSPLDAGLLTMQASNEGAERQLAMNKNQGAAGLAWNEMNPTTITVEQAQFMRRQFNSIVNDSDLAGSIAVMNGKWGYQQFGLDAVKLQLLEQSDIQFRTLCNIYDVPWQLFGNSDSYENRKQYKRDLIYDNIAVAAYSYRDELNAKLIREYGLDRERDVIDADVISLPELSEDMKQMADTLGKLWQLTPNQVLEYIGYEVSTDPNMDKIYIPSGLTPLDQMNAPIGDDLTNEMDQLNQLGNG